MSHSLKDLSPATADFSMGSNKITNLTDPSSAQDASTKAYTDAVASGLAPHALVQYATAAALPANTYNNGASGVGATLTAVSNAALTVDGSAVQIGDRILVKDEVTQANNGIYDVTVAGSGILVYILTRSTDADSSAELLKAYTFTTGGSTNIGGGFNCLNTSAITMGTTAITFSQFNQVNNYVAGTNIDITGLTISAPDVVPYTGATTDLDLGAFTLTADELFASTATISNNLDVTNNITASGITADAMVVDTNSGLLLKSAGTHYMIVGVSSITGSNKTFTVDLGNANRTLTFAGDATVSGTTSGTNTGDQTNISGNAATVTTNANMTGAITSSGSNVTSLGSFTSTQLATALTNETGSGVAVFNSQPTIAGIILSPGTASISPIKFSLATSVLTTTAVAGAFETDTIGTPYYSYANSGRGVIEAPQFISLTSAYTLTSTTALQKLFNASPSGALTVQASTSYFFECNFQLSAMSGSSNVFSFGIGGTATLTGIDYTAIAKKANTASSSAASMIRGTTASAVALVAASNQTTGMANITGIIRINAGGTIIPQVSLGVAAAAIVGVNAWFKITPIGTNTVTFVGNWS